VPGHPGGVGEEGMRVLAGVEARGRCPVASWRVSRLRARGCTWEGVEAEESRRDFSGTGARRGGSGTTDLVSGAVDLVITAMDPASKAAAACGWGRTMDGLHGPIHSFFFLFLILFHGRTLCLPTID
jgi:hypothetical protein